VQVALVMLATLAVIAIAVQPKLSAGGVVTANAASGRWLARG
jgi:hypothetical protein